MNLWYFGCSRFRGSCYKAANWTYVGQSQGRGRQDRAKEAGESIKDIYLYPLVEDFRERMGVAPEAGEVALGLEDPVDGSSWASREFGGAELGDRRLSKRLVAMAEAKAEHPGLSWPQVFEGDRASTDAYYRFIGAEEDSELQMSRILAPHRDCTIRRMKGQNRLLCVMDASDLDYSDLRRCEGLGVIGKNQTETLSKGLELFSSFVLNMQGLPLGVLRAQCTAPELRPERKGKDRRYIPGEEKDTYKWIEGLRDIRELSRRLPGTKLGAVADRESDFFEFFDEWRQEPSVDLVVRAKHDRKACQAQAVGLEESSLFEELRATPAQSRLELHVPRKREKAPKGKNPGRRARPARKAQVAVKKTQDAGNSRRNGRRSRSTRRSSGSEQGSGSGTPSDLQRLSKTSRLVLGC